MPPERTSGGARVWAVAPSRSSPLLRGLRVAVIALVALLAGSGLLFISVSPAVEGDMRPTARDVAAARAAWQQVSKARGSGEAVRVRIDNRMIGGLAALASDATKRGRFEGEVAEGVLSGKASLSLPAGLWINASGAVSGRHEGFPAFSLTVGRVTFPGFMSRWIADLGRHALRLRGATIPPLDEVVRQFDVDRADVIAEITLPERSGMVNELIAAGSHDLNQPLVSDIYCELAAGQREAPVSDLARMVRRAFDPSRASPSEERTRATFVALSLLVVGDQARHLAPKAAEMARKCPRPPRQLRLQQRDDLAKHWTFSAAIAAVLGEETSTSLGEWKELDDSLPDGSGFSFVDLAADRAGLRTALRALDPATANRTLDGLARATEESLMPGTLLGGPEGLPEASFVDDFGGLDRERYRQAVAAIDRELAKE